MTDNGRFDVYEEYLKNQIESARARLDADPDNDMAHGLYSAYSRALEEWRKAKAHETK